MTCKHHINVPNAAHLVQCKRYAPKGSSIPCAAARPDPNLCNDGRGWQKLPMESDR